MATDIVGSRMRSDAFYGQNGSAQPSSIRPGDPAIKRSQVAESILAANNARGMTKPDAPDWQTRKISAAPIKASPTMRSRSGEGGKIPTSLNRGVVAPSVKPAKAGAMKR
jgi:hypothetical protein